MREILRVLECRDERERVNVVIDVKANVLVTLDCCLASGMLFVAIEIGGI